MLVQYAAILQGIQVLVISQVAAASDRGNIREQTGRRCDFYCGTLSWHIGLHYASIEDNKQKYFSVLARI
ncbi:MAG: hypothetical protein NZ744_11220 [Pirellulaceae bacterium]|nr:hypothetical protein [Pirellulaceae bacterium]